MFHVGYTFSWVMECFERGILTKEDTDGLELRFGCDDKEGLIDLLRKITMKEGFGKLLAMGCAEAAKVVGQGSEQYCLAVKGQELEGIPQRNVLMVALGEAGLIQMLVPQLNGPVVGFQRLPRSVTDGPARPPACSSPSTFQQTG